jgi:hypothetical protein
MTDNLENLIGMKEQDAREACREGKIMGNGVVITSVRVRVRNGEPIFGTCDFCEDRVNVRVENGIITEVFRCG